MQCTGMSTSMNRCRLFAAWLAATVIASGGLGVAQRADDWAVDQAQRAVTERMTSREGGRDLTVRFGSDARTEFPSNTNVRVRGTGTVTRIDDGKARPFSYEAIVNTRNSNVSDLKYDWRGDWYDSGGRRAVANA